LLAVLLARTNMAGRRWAAALLGLLLVLPLFVQLAGWDALFGKLGWLSMLTDSIAHPFLAGMRGAIWVHGMAAVPWVAAIVAVGLLQVEPQLEEAALLDASPLSVLVRVTLPRAWPYLLGAAVWTAVGTAAEMTVTNIYIVSTYTEELYNSFALSADALLAGWHVLPAISLLVCLAGATVLVLQRLGAAADVVLQRTPLVFSLGKGRAAVSLLTWLAVLPMVALPIASLIFKAGMQFSRGPTGDIAHRWSPARTLAVVGAAPRQFATEFQWSVITAVEAATLAVMLAVALVWWSRRGGWRAFPLAVALAVGIAVPGPLVATSIIWLLNRDLPGFIWLYDRTTAAPALAQAVRALPVAILIVWPALRSVRREVLEAATLDGAGNWTLLARVALPLRRRALAAAWLAGVAVALGDLSYSLLVIPPGQDTIQRRIFGLVHSGVDEQDAAACLFLAAGYAAIVAAIGWFLRPNSKAI
jgi:iron(III) transport system permease protein